MSSRAELTDGQWETFYVLVLLHGRLHVGSVDKFRFSECGVVDFTYRFSVAPVTSLIGQLEFGLQAILTLVRT